MRFTEQQSKEVEDKFKFTIVQDIGQIEGTDLSIQFGHYGSYGDKYYLFRTTEGKNGKTYTKSFSFSADELNALADFLNK